MLHSIECILCKAEHSFEVIPGEHATYWHPGNGAEIDWRKRDCQCRDHAVVDHDRYEEMMEARALQSASMDR